MRKPFFFCICENKDADQLISAFVFAIRIVQSLYYLNPKFQAPSHLLCVCSPVCVRPGRKPRIPIFSQRGSNNKSPNIAARHKIPTKKTKPKSPPQNGQKYKLLFIRGATYFFVTIIFCLLFLCATQCPTWRLFFAFVNC